MNSQEIPYLRSWLLFFLVATVGGGIVGMILGAIIGAVLGAIGVPQIRIGMVTGVIGFLIGIPISFFTFKWSVSQVIVAPLIKANGQPPT
jgi:hypothetical protein